MTKTRVLVDHIITWKRSNNTQSFLSNTKESTYLLPLNTLAHPHLRRLHNREVPPQPSPPRPQGTQWPCGTPRPFVLVHTLIARTRHTLPPATTRIDPIALLTQHQDLVIAVLFIGLGCAAKVVHGITALR